MTQRREPASRLKRSANFQIRVVPELPDVEHFRRVLREHVMGKRVNAVEVLDHGVIRGRSSFDFVGQLVGRRFLDPERYGKWLVAGTDGPKLLFHFGMTGALTWKPVVATISASWVAYGLSTTMTMFGR
jgi:formamidopyrimidine-DNA glycosylase